MGSLDRFSPATRSWFSSTFAAPTDAQERGWDAIGRGEHALILAPTGSGKTLAAFLWALDRLLTTPVPEDEGKRCRVLYVSPLKALTYDVERNLRAPLAGIALAAERAGGATPLIRVATRTGDTPQSERRDLLRHPPDILITTPESLYLLLTSSARLTLASVEHVIVDEIHAVAATKRGTHLALSLERLERLAPGARRIGLSATQRPLDELARFLGGRRRGQGGEWEPRPVTVVDAGVRKPLELEVIVPVDDMSELGRPIESADGSPLLNGPAAGDPEVRHSIWPAIQAELLALIRSHRSTLIFVNSRRLAERLANRLNELAGEELVRAHHGSIAREQRLDIEDALKAGKLPALVATSSLELGIDMGAIDLVVQVESPPSVAAGLQRVGRAGHQVGEPSKGRLFPKFRGDLVVSAVTAQRMQDGLIEETHVPRNPLDVLAQQIVAMAAIEEVTVDEVAEVAWGAYPFAELTRDLLEGVLDMLAGRYPSDEFAELRPRLTWDRVAGTLTARPGARMLAVTSGGTIPDRGLFGVFTPEGSRVGELDEEMVYESRVGETFLLGATTWRIEEISRDRVVVTPAPGEPGKMPFWKGDQVGRPYELGQALGAFLRQVDTWDDDKLRTDAGLDDRAVKNLRSYLAEERAATGGLLPTDRQLVVERFRDELGDWRICVLSPFGARVHAPWALAVEAKIRDQLGFEVQAIWNDDGIVIRLPEADESPPVDWVTLDPDEVDDLVVAAVGSSGLFASRFRENAARALLLPRRRPGSRTPLWQMRQRAADLLNVASKYGSFPILLETYRECLRDVFDLPALVSLMGDIRSRKVRIASVDTQTPSPFASSLAFAYIANFMYEGDAPLAERRAQALTLDRRMLAELVGSDELRELIDPEALAALEDDLQCLDERRWATDLDGAHDLLLRLGDLTPPELRARCTFDPGDDLVSTRRAISIGVAGEQRLIAVEDAARYRDGLGAALPNGIPEALLEPVADARLQLVRRWARTHGPFLAVEPALRFGIGVEAVGECLDRLVADDRIVRGAFRPEGSEREWCDVEVLRLLRQRSLAALRREIEPAEVEALARFLPAWHGIGSEATGVDRCFEAIRQLQGVPIPASVLERDVLNARVRDYSPRLLDDLLAAGEVMWAGAAPLGRDDGKVVLVLRDQAALLLPRLGLGGSNDRPAGDEHERLRQVLAQRGAVFFRDLGGASDSATLDALWDLVWAGEVTNDSFAAVRALSAKRRSGGKARGGRPRMGSLAVLGPPRAQGRWSLVEREVAADAAMTPTAGAHAVAGVLLDRHGVLTREAARGEGIPGGFASVYPVLRAMEEAGRIRRGYFVAGLGGAQFALPGAVDRLRAFRDRTPDGVPQIVVLAATDPANAYGLSIPWPVKGPQRAAGAYVVLLDGLASLYVDKGGRGLTALRPFDGTWEESAVTALGALLERGRFSRISVERCPAELEPYLREASFVPTPKGLVRYA
ncbi:MAG: ATP-dependent helicase Lhr and Lhr-like helicase [Actinomycetota bacterium]|jgi:ATP-dependent Lhr-like helicase|nr:ATP-dependent helicase Lhr and Lhr-like helicase [Actinomycetota bacterium]